MPLSPRRDGVRLAVRLTPRAAKNSIGGCAVDADGRGMVKAYVTAIPEGGKANKSLINMLSKAVKIPASKISVASGPTNRNKQIFFEGVPDELLERLGQWIEDIPHDR